ncbi:MAG: helicase-exonuclease AddAB subunit AddA [Lachnospiraceae bacterium]|nr:helicase-exonuclease AddAB subunit AddA [Lachnospiraceae bacterium]
MEYTDEQLKAIQTRGSQLLVSAAAGSGKTAVLVERIIRRILDEDDPVDIDRMLIMTFTKAAAAQMKEKIIKAIDAERAEKPGDLNLIRQSALVHNARITTIHGFCLDVIRDHFQEIGLDPSFRVADEGECRLLKQSVIEEVMEKAYEEGSEAFVDMTECLAAGKNDNALEDILNDLYDFSMSDPNPGSWLERCASVYEDVSEDTIDDSEWMKVVLDSAKLTVENAAKKASEAYDLSGGTNGPYMYLQAVENDMELLDDLKTCSDHESYRKRLKELSWAKLGRAQKDGPYVDPDISDKVKGIRNDYKASVNKLITGEFALPVKEQINRIRACAPIVKELTRLTQKIITGYSEIKRDKKVVDFDDLEHMCIAILSAGDGNTAREYRNFFEEIYVDEYQDSNLTQEELLKYIAREDNLFMVGDVKQSIYSFRLARPQLFMSKYTDFKPVGSTGENGGGIRIDLSHNFRSRSSVLTSVNELFYQIMSRDLGGIDYDEAAALKAGASFPCNDTQTGTELILIPHEKGINDRDLEAKVIAARINELMKYQFIFDPTDDDPNRMRRIRYGDIVILLRSAKGWDEKFMKTLLDEGIPVNVMSRTGYFGAYEISCLLDYLTVLDNPLQDIPMAAVLRSYFGCFDDEELALIRTAYPAKYIFLSVKACAENSDGTGDEGRPAGIKRETRAKAADFLDRFNSFRDKIGYTSVYELMLEIIDGDYGIYVSSLPNGKRKKANLNMLLKKAEDYGKTSYKGLFHFVKYIEMLRKYEVDYGEANVTDEADDVVQIMTIHKSKGLEFPVCFVAGMHKKYNLMDSRATIIPDIDIGLGVELVDPGRRIKQTTMVKLAASRKKMYEVLAEEERILYVAMTRAKEKLIMTAIVNDMEEELKKDKGVVKATSYLDLLIHGLNNEGLPSVTVSGRGAADLIDSGIHEAVGLEAGREVLKGMLAGRKTEMPDDGLAGIIKDRFTFKYPYENEKNVFEKVSVTELKRRSMEGTQTEDKELPAQTKELFAEESTLHVQDKMSEYIPDFMLGQDKEIPATLHGTAVHRIFELWDYERDATYEDIEAFLGYVKQEGLMQDELADSVRIEEISDFLNGELASRMRKASMKGQLYREQPFIFSCNDMLIQGIIDAYFLEDDEIVIVDYKTDRVDDINELTERYHVQLEYYGMALSAMLDKPVRDLIIYSTRFKNTVKVPCTVLN